MEYPYLRLYIFNLLRKEEGVKRLLKVFKYIICYCNSVANKGYSLIHQSH